MNVVTVHAQIHEEGNGAVIPPRKKQFELQIIDPKESLTSSNKAERVQVANLEQVGKSLENFQTNPDKSQCFFFLNWPSFMEA